MEQLSEKIKRAVGRYQPITTEGVTLYPVKVKDGDAFAISRPALEFMQQTLPVRLMSLPLLQAYYVLDYEALNKGEEPVGLFSRALLGLALSLRVGEGKEPSERLKSFQLVATGERGERLKSIRLMLNGEERIEITPVQYQRMRPILAAQNGVELVPETANPELVQAEKDLAEQNAPKLNASMETLIASVCALTGADESDIDEWPLLKLKNRSDALQRVMSFIVCGIGEAQGTRWAKGNPVPHPFYPRVKESDGGMIALSDFAGGAAVSAVENS